METRPLFVLVSCTLALLPFWIYLLYIRRKNTLNSGEHGHQVVPVKALLNFNKNCVTLDVASAINQLLKSPDPDSRLKCLHMIQQSSSFSSNFPVFRKSGCLESMLRLLDGNDGTVAVKKQNLCIIQSVTNFACDIDSLHTIEPYLGELFRIANRIDYSDQACAAIQLLCNIALTPGGCRLLDDRIHDFCTMLQSRDTHMLRQIFSLLVNLSCDPGSCELLLMSETPHQLMDTFSFCLSLEVQPLVTSQAICFLRNVYSRISPLFVSVLSSTKDPSEAPTLRTFLWQSRSALLLRLDYFLAELPSTESATELKNQAEDLRSTLTNLSDKSTGHVSL